jgi:hypothetical protein
LCHIDKVIGGFIMTITYKVKVFSENGTTVYEKEIRADYISCSNSGMYSFFKDQIDILQVPIKSTIIEKI